MAYTYGLCGLKLVPSAAVIIDQCYNGGFMTGRVTGIFISKVLKPRTMIFISLVACIGSSIILVIFGAPSTDENSKYYGVYIGTCLLGYFVSWQFGSCYSWIARKGDITGLLAPLFLIGCGTGGSIFPPVTGAVFRSETWGPVGILYLTLIFCIIQSLLYSVMYLLSKRKDRRIYDFELEHRTLAENNTVIHGRQIKSSNSYQ